ncbi:hypothetical protein OJ998_33735 [Solirubrobacter taibaiensis]|nr:hypothetical protein [Solirubrobacter taibaiensis]
MKRLGSIVILAGLLIGAAPATAATVTASDEYLVEVREGGEYVRTVHFTAAPGELNRLALSNTPERGLRLHDPAGITPTAPCFAEDPQTAVCPLRGTILLRASLGDGDDTLTSTALGVNAAWAFVDAGEGSDAVDYPHASIAGGPGDDTLTGQRVAGGPGADVIRAEELDYTDHTEGVTVDLAGGPAGAAGENDQVLPGARSVTGGSGPDVLRAGGVGRSLNGGVGDDLLEGSAGPDLVSAGPGNDVIRGQGGNDSVSGGLGDDRLEGGAGNDSLWGDDGDDVVDGGPGRDTLGGRQGTDILLARDGERDAVGCGNDSSSGRFEGDRATIDTQDVDDACQHVTGARRLVLHGLTRAGVRSVRIVLSCNAARACAARLRVDGGRAVARVRVPAGRRVRVPVRLKRGHGPVSVRVITPAKRVMTARLGAARP